MPQISPHSGSMQAIDGIAAIAARYDGFILDLWGVIHDGSHLYPGVHDTLVKLRQQGKKMIMLSNAPRRVRKVEAVLHQLGIEPALYDHVLSSGEVGYHWLASGQPTFGRRYYYIGPAKDLDVLDGLDYRRVDDLKEADFLLNVGFGSEGQNDDDWSPLLRAARGLSLPMVCLNPDLEVVRITGERAACAGVHAQSYQRMGGQVIWFGKPYPGVYEECMQVFGAMDKSRIVAIGDSLETDIPGAVRFGIDSVLVTGGILKTLPPSELAALCRRMELYPSYIIPHFNW
jgi:HAD superfamily hydrolase (TIGR01459 family)